MRTFPALGDRASLAALAVRSSLIAALLALTGACTSQDRPDENAREADTATPASPAAPSPGAVAAEAAPAPTDPRVIALGDSIFHGRAAGGACFTCHGQDGKGTQIGPNLTDGQWLHGDGSYQFIVNTVTSGVPTPKQYEAAMPPMGGASLTPDQVRAVAAYVYSFRRHGS